MGFQQQCFLQEFYHAFFHGFLQAGFLRKSFLETIQDFFFIILLGFPMENPPGHSTGNPARITSESTYSKSFFWNPSEVPSEILPEVPSDSSPEVPCQNPLEVALWNLTDFGSRESSTTDGIIRGFPRWNFWKIYQNNPWRNLKRNTKKRFLETSSEIVPEWIHNF